MKDLFKKVFSKKISSPIFVGFGTFAIFTFIVFPGLTAANTALNIISALVGIFALTFVFYYINADKVLNDLMIEPGETELDYVNPEELKPKKKTTKKKTVKSEFPVEPHHKTIKKK
jgi:hypothetical protein